MRNVKSFLVSGITLCVLYLVMQSTFFSTSFVDDTQARGEKIYSPFLSGAMDADESEVEERQEETHEPVEEHREEPSVPVEEHIEGEIPAQAEERKEAPASEAPASEAPAEERHEAPAQTTPATNTQAAPAPVAENQPPAESKPEAGGEAQDQPAAPVEEAKEELVGFDTIDLAEPSGNWLLKRMIWEKAQSKYEQIKGAFDQVLESRMPFFKRRAEIDRQTLDPLYISVGLDQQEIAGILEEFNILLSVDQDKHPLGEREQKMRMAAIEEKKVLEQLQKDVADLDKYSKALDSFLDKLIEQVNLGRAAEKQAWQAYKNIGSELNDKKARELWLGMETPLKRITDIQGYINGVFKQEFDKVCSTIGEHATRIKDAMQSLKEKGFDLKQFSKEMDEKLRKQAKPVCEVPQEPEQEGWLAMITSWWNSFVDGISGIFDSIMSYFSGAESEEEAAVEKKHTEKKAPEAPASQDVQPEPQKE